MLLSPINLETMNDRLISQGKDPILYEFVVDKINKGSKLFFASEEEYYQISHYEDTVWFERYTSR